VIVGGAFTSAGGVAVSDIARFSTSTGTWSALGSGITGPFSVVNALAVLPGGDVLVGGAFTSAGGVAANNIARFNPSTGTWSALGTSTNDTVNALAVLPGGDVLVGGFFTSAGGVAANRIARVNPNTNAWSALGAGVNGSVRALAVLPGGDVIVAGDFGTAGGVVASRIARVNPNTNAWSALGAGTDNQVRALAVLPGGDALVGGTFSSAGGVPASRIARLNPNTSAWSALGSGVTSTFSFAVDALAVLPGGDALVGGSFTTAGGLAASNIARYQPGAPTPSIVLQPLSQVASISGTIQFGVAAVESAGGTPSYLWRKNGVPISTVTNPSAGTPVLTLSNVQAADVASYECIISNSCGNVAVLSNAATLTLAGTPASNACAGAATIGNGTFTFSTVGATTDGPVENTIGFGSGDFQVNQDVWFSYTATCSGTVTVNMCASGFDTKVAIYNGATCPTAPNTAIAGNDDSAVCNPNSLRSFATFSATAGNRYLIRVGGFITSVGGNVSMTISCTSSPCGPSDIAGPNQSIGADGQLTADDIIVFLGRYFQGCP
jgi:hypothetical protein